MKHLTLGIMFALAFVLLCADSQSWAWFVATKLAGAGIFAVFVVACNSLEMDG